MIHLDGVCAFLIEHLIEIFLVQINVQINLCTAHENGLLQLTDGQMFDALAEPDDDFVSCLTQSRYSLTKIA